MGDRWEAALDDLFERPAHEGISLAVVVMIDGELVAERYGMQPANELAAEVVVDADTPLVSWSMAKSITHAAVGIAAGEGILDPDAPASVPGWAGTDKASITLLDLLEMRSGLHFVEDYVDAGTSNCLEMLFGAGATDHAGYAAALPLEHPPGTVWNYSSGSTNIVCRILGEAVGGGEQGMRRFLASRLFVPAGMASADPVFDAAGTFVGSSYVYATARDFARFGELYRNDGVAGGQRILPPGWTRHAATQIAVDPETGFGYGRHWWLWPQYDGALAAHGYEGQFTLVVPDKRLVLVHLGKTPSEERPGLVERLHGLVALAG